MKSGLTALIILTLFSSCGKELRTKTYPLTAFNGSGMSGFVSFVETKNKNVTTVRLEAAGLQPDVTYPTHLRTGTLDSLINTLINFTDVRTASGSIIREQPWNISYEEALQSNTCFNLHDPANPLNNFAGYHLAGNTGRNAPRRVAGN